MGDYPAAMDYYEQALLISRKVGNRMEEMYTYINLSATEIAQGRADEAFAWIEKAFEFSNSHWGANGGRLGIFLFGSCPPDKR